MQNNLKFSRIQNAKVIWMLSRSYQCQIEENIDLAVRRWTLDFSLGSYQCCDCMSIRACEWHAFEIATFFLAWKLPLFAPGHFKLSFLRTQRFSFVIKMDQSNKVGHILHSIRSNLSFNKSSKVHEAEGLIVKDCKNKICTELFYFFPWGTLTRIRG